MGPPFAILITDLHLTEKQEDQYRFNIFPWLVTRHSKDKSIRAVFILGDLTDRKDNHSAWFVNKIVSSLRALTAHFDDVFILKGNHDAADPNSHQRRVLQRPLPYDRANRPRQADDRH